ncbi:hypothetical protein ACVWZM_007412 [Bradyrhizobium sp. USDA 4501]
MRKLSVTTALATIAIVLTPAVTVAQGTGSGAGTGQPFVSQPDIAASHVAAGRDQQRRDRAILRRPQYRQGRYHRIGNDDRERRQGHRRRERKSRAPYERHLPRLLTSEGRALMNAGRADVSAT